MADGPLLDSADIQGNILPGFRREQQLHLGYMAPSETALRAALKVLAPGITRLATTLEHREQRKMAFLAGTPQPKSAELWLNVALGAAALDRLGDGAVRKLDVAFDAGMRPSRTGDPWRAKDDQGKPNPSHPSNWKVGSPSQPLDLLVIAAYDNPVAAGIDALIAQLAATGIQEIYREPGVRLPLDQEHFGFADGISEVGVRGTVEIDGVPRPLTTRYGVPAQNGVEFGKPAQPLVWPGQFLVGAATGANTVDNAPARYRNGSFLVFRRLSQDVRAFDADTAAIAQAHSTPEKALAAERLRAMIVGRWPSGAALMRHQSEPGVADGLLSANYFSFGTASPDLQLASGTVTGAIADPAPSRGLQCPAFAHIRKVNPRDLPTDLGDRDRTRSFQMLRRGIPFGPPYDRTNPESATNSEPRGLLFFAYQRAISLQFERLNTNWMNTEKGPAEGGFDLLVGQHVAADTGLYLSKSATLYSAPAPAPGEQVVAPANWVKPTGGAYLFAPSLTHIRSLAEPEIAPVVEHVFLAVAGFELEEPFAKGLELPELAFPQHAGETRTSQQAGRQDLIEGRWPATALLSPAALALASARLGSLDLSGDHFPTEVLAPNAALALAAAPRLESLQLDGTGLAGVTIATLVRNLPYVSNLNLAGCDLDDVDIATLAEIHPSLKALTIGLASPRNGHRFTAPRLTPRVLGGLARFSKLRRISLRGVPLPDDAVTGTSFWKDLEAIDLGETIVGDASALHLAQSPALRELRLDQTAVGDAGAAALLARPLDTLSLSWSRVTVNGLNDAPASPTLHTLHLAGLAVNDQFAPVLGRMTSLSEIDLSNTAVADSVAATLAGLPNLTSINIAQTSITRSGLAQLAGSMNAGSVVAILDATRLPADREIFNRLAGSPSLRKVSLSVGTDWRSLEGIQADVQLQARVPNAGGPPPRLTSLWLSGDFSGDVASRFANLKWLQTVALNGSARGANFGAGFPALGDFRAERAGLEDQALAALVRLPRMEALYISGNPVAGAFEDWQGAHIHTLELRDTLIDDRALRSIATLPKLHCLDVPGSHVTAAGVAMLARRGHNLQSLALDGRQVDAASAQALAAHDRLAEIYLYGATVDLSTLRALASVRMRELALIGTSLTDEAVPILAGMPGLRRLSLGSELSDAGIESLQALRPDLTLYRDGARPVSSRRP